MTSFFQNMKTRHRENMVKENLNKELNEAVKDVQLNKLLEENDTYATSEDASRSLVMALEAIFIHGVRETFAERLSSAFGDPDRKPTPDFWSPMMIFTPRHTISKVNNFSQISNDVGRSRCWIRLVLNEGFFLGYLMTISQEMKALKPYYKNTAFLLDQDRLNIAVSYFQGLAQFKFSYPVNSSVLNYWSNEVLLLAGLWTPPMKECPVSSGMDVVKGLPDYDSDGGSVKSSSSLSASQKLLLDDDEALKIILNTPTEGSPLMSRLEGSDPVRSGTRDAASSPMKEFEEAVETKIEDPPEIQNVDEPLPTSVSPTPQSNPIEVPPAPPPCNTLLSYDTILQSYLPESSPLIPEPELTAFIKNYEPSISVPNTSIVEPDDNLVDPLFESGYEIIEPSKSSGFKYLVDMVRNGKIVQELGLDSQGFSCKDCGVVVGISHAKARVCGLSGLYYCEDCFKNFEFVIPARIVHNWDFMKYPVSPHSCEFLNEIHMHPLINIRLTNPRIYFAIDEMDVVHKQRLKLNLMRQYLFTCQDPTKNRLQNLLWPREYLYEHVHLYSIMDLMEAANGTLQVLLKKAITFSEDHVRSCTLCSQKGFICEICTTAENSPRPIFPFDIENVYRCSQCRSIYHQECMKMKIAEEGCPKCWRIQTRKLKMERNLSLEN